jgi:glycosyltransferase involved in cell wall biosynthesis
MNLNKDDHLVSVIIPTINRSSLAEVLAALNNQTRTPDEIIVMEDKYRRGQSVMRNEGIDKSKGDLIAFLDDDNVPGEKWLEIFINEIDKYNADGVSSNYSEDDPFLHEIRQRRKFPVEVVINPDGYFGTGGNCMYRRKCFEECKLKNGFVFNPDNRMTQDIELALELRSHGYKLVYVVNNVKHLKRLPPFGYLVHKFNRGTGIYRLYALKNSYKKIEFGPGLLWNDYAKKYPVKKWFLIFWQRIFGPFDYRSFSRFDYFILFWAGEKTKAAGFFFAFIKNKLKFK